MSWRWQCIHIDWESSVYEINEDLQCAGLSLSQHPLCREQITADQGLNLVGLSTKHKPRNLERHHQWTRPGSIHRSKQNHARTTPCRPNWRSRWRKSNWLSTVPKKAAESWADLHPRLATNRYRLSSMQSRAFCPEAYGCPLHGPKIHLCRLSSNPGWLVQS